MLMPVRTTLEFELENSIPLYLTRLCELDKNGGSARAPQRIAGKAIISCRDQNHRMRDA